jgi:hypothetical protein
MGDVVKRVTVPAGRYYIGDPCYAVPRDLWMEWLGASDYTNDAREHVLAGTVNGYQVVGVATAHGDGVYTDQLGNKYPVDAGLLGLVPVGLVEGERLDLMLIDLQEPAECWHDTETGDVHLGPTIIETGAGDDEDEDDEEDGELWI